MAKDGTARGGARVGAGRKSKALADKLNQGMTADILAFPEPADMEGVEVPPVKDFLKPGFQEKAGVDAFDRGNGYGICKEKTEGHSFL